MQMVHIATQTLSADANFVFDNIPQTYKHLHIRIYGRGKSAFTDGLSQYFACNNDFGGGGNNYSFHHVFGYGGGSYSSGYATSNNIMSTPQVYPDSTAGTGFFGSTVTDILDYSNTNKYKTFRVIGGWDKNGGGRTVMGGGHWRSNNAITRLDVQTDGGFLAGSRVSIYGVIA